MATEEAKIRVTIEDTTDAIEGVVNVVGAKIARRLLGGARAGEVTAGQIASAQRREGLDQEGREREREARRASTMGPIKANEEIVREAMEKIDITKIFDKRQDQIRAWFIRNPTVLDGFIFTAGFGKVRDGVNNAIKSLGQMGALIARLASYIPMPASARSLVNQIRKVSQVPEVEAQAISAGAAVGVEIAKIAGLARTPPGAEQLGNIAAEVKEWETEEARRRKDLETFRSQRFGQFLQKHLGNAFITGE